MKGEFVKNKLKNEGFILEEVALAMGISPQNLQSKLKSNDIKVGVLQEICKSINKSIYFFFDQGTPNEFKEPAEVYELSNTAVDADSIAEKVYQKIAPQLQQIVNKQIIIEAALAEYILNKDAD
jgi:transcriptional regulator with XRE-family HTH domain